MSKEDCDVLVNILLLGDYGVGKSSLMYRFTENAFKVKHVSTLEADFKVKKIVMDGRRIRIHVWDTAGQERYEALTPKFFRGANGVVLVYDITNEESFNNLRQWLLHLNKNCHSDISKVLVGNKADLCSSSRKVSFTDAKTFAHELGVTLLETSAKNDENVEDAFYSVIERVLHGKPLVQSSKEYLVKDEEERKKVFCHCCT